ncbi:MAG TPA: metal ABC transporter permease, partial [Candidatus Wirthbacteria bacterium]|nr:metal ABC transporter permease [Candidatus Wirthbacteria bacterium]
MIDTLSNYLQYGFVQRAFIAGSFIALVCAVLGVFLVLRKMSLIGDGLAHVSFGAIALGLFINVMPFYFALLVVGLAALAIMGLEQSERLSGDTAIGIVSAVGIAGGVVLASLAGGFN